LRGYASLGVAFFHLFPMYILGVDNPIGPLAAGVDVFFVISGFIMWHISRERDASPQEFLLSRLIRIAPPYWVATLILAACATLKPNLFPLDHPTVGHVLASIGFIPHGEGIEDRPLLTQGWTLNFEMFFYVVFAGTLLLKRKLRLAAISLAFGLLVLIGLFISKKNPATGVYFSPLLLEFLAGIYIAVAVERRILVPKLLAYAAIPISVVFIFLSVGELGHRAIYWGLPAALIVWSMVSLEVRDPFPDVPVLMLFGAASYSIYVTHFLAGSFYQIIAAVAGLPVHGPVAYMLGLTTVIAAGIAFHLLIEKNSERFLKPLLKRL